MHYDKVVKSAAAKDDKEVTYFKTIEDALDNFESQVGGIERTLVDAGVELPNVEPIQRLLSRDA